VRRFERLVLERVVPRRPTLPAVVLERPRDVAETTEYLRQGGLANVARDPLHANEPVAARLTLVAIVLGADTTVLDSGNIDRGHFREGRRLLEWGFSSFELEVLLEAGGYITEVQVKNGKNVSHVLATPSTPIYAILPDKLDPALLELNPTLISESVKAPVKKGDVLGSIGVFYDGVDYGETPLNAVADVNLSVLRFISSTITGLFLNVWALLALVIFTLCAVLLQLHRIRRSKARRAQAKKRAAREKSKNKNSKNSSSKNKRR